MAASAADLTTPKPENLLIQAINETVGQDKEAVYKRLNEVYKQFSHISDKAKTHDHFTPLQHATRRQNLWAVAWLLEKDRDLVPRGRFKNPRLKFAEDKDHPSALDLAVTYADQAGESKESKASQAQVRRAIIELLIEADKDPFDPSDQYYVSAINQAHRNQNHYFLELLSRKKFLVGSSNNPNGWHIYKSLLPYAVDQQLYSLVEACVQVLRPIRVDDYQAYLLKAIDKGDERLFNILMSDKEREDVVLIKVIMDRLFARKISYKVAKAFLDKLIENRHFEGIYTKKDELVDQILNNHDLELKPEEKAYLLVASMRAIKRIDSRNFNIIADRLNNPDNQEIFSAFMSTLKVFNDSFVSTYVADQLLATYVQHVQVDQFKRMLPFAKTIPTVKPEAYHGTIETRRQMEDLLALVNALYAYLDSTKQASALEVLRELRDRMNQGDLNDILNLSCYKTQKAALDNTKTAGTLNTPVAPPVFVSISSPQPESQFAAKGAGAGGAAVPIAAPVLVSLSPAPEVKANDQITDASRHSIDKDEEDEEEVEEAVEAASMAAQVEGQPSPDVDYYPGPGSRPDQQREGEVKKAVVQSQSVELLGRAVAVQAFFPAATEQKRPDAAVAQVMPTPLSADDDEPGASVASGMGLFAAPQTPVVRSVAPMVNTESIAQTMMLLLAHPIPDRDAQNKAIQHLAALYSCYNQDPSQVTGVAHLSFSRFV